MEGDAVSGRGGVRARSLRRLASGSGGRRGITGKASSGRGAGSPRSPRGRCAHGLAWVSPHRGPHPPAGRSGGGGPAPAPAPAPRQYLLRAEVPAQAAGASCGLGHGRGGSGARPSVRPSRGVTVAALRRPQTQGPPLAPPGRTPGPSHPPAVLWLLLPGDGGADALGPGLGRWDFEPVHRTGAPSPYLPCPSSPSSFKPACPCLCLVALGLETLGPGTDAHSWG